MKKLFFILIAMCFVPIAQAYPYEISFEAETYDIVGPSEVTSVEVKFDSDLFTEDTVTYKDRKSNSTFYENEWKSNYDPNLLAVQVKVNGEIICPHRFAITTRGSTMGIFIYSLNKYGFEQRIYFGPSSDDIHAEAYNITDFILEAPKAVQIRYPWNPPCEEDADVFCRRLIEGHAFATISPDTFYYGPSTPIHGPPSQAKAHGNRQCH